METSKATDCTDKEATADDSEQSLTTVTQKMGLRSFEEKCFFTSVMITTNKKIGNNWEREKRVTKKPLKMQRKPPKNPLDPSLVEEEIRQLLQQPAFVCSSLCLLRLEAGREVTIINGTSHRPATVVSNKGAALAETWIDMKKILDSSTLPPAVVFKYKDSPQERISIKLGDLKSGTNESQLRLLVRDRATITVNVLSKFLSPAKLPEHNKVFSFLDRLVSEVHGDSLHSMTILQVARSLQLEATRRNVIHEGQRHARTKIKMAATIRQFDFAHTDPLSIAKLATQELTNSAKLTELNSIVNEMVDKKLELQLKSISKLAEPSLDKSLLSVEDFKELVVKFQEIFPIQSRLKMTEGVSITNTSTSQEERGRRAMMAFVFQQRRCNRNFCTRLAEVFGVSYDSCGVTKRGIQALNRLGACCSRAQLFVVKKRLLLATSGVLEAATDGTIATTTTQATNGAIATTTQATVEAATDTTMETSAEALTEISAEISTEITADTTAAATAKETAETPTEATPTEATPTEATPTEETPTEETTTKATTTKATTTKETTTKATTVISQPKKKKRKTTQAATTKPAPPSYSATFRKMADLLP